MYVCYMYANEYVCMLHPIKGAEGKTLYSNCTNPIKCSPIFSQQLKDDLFISSFGERKSISLNKESK